MNFLAPYALWGLALLSIPIIVHLFRPRKVRQTPFSSLRWLHLTQQRLSRRIKWHQVLLFLLRAAFITLLVLALARPMLTPAGAGQVTERFIVLDVSRSMSYRVGDKPSPLERGKQLAADLVASLQPGDRCALFITGSSTHVLWPLVKDAESRLPVLHTVRASATDTDLDSALPLVGSMLGQCRPGADVEVFVITDNQQQSWNQGGIAAFTKELPATVKVRVVDVGITSPQNAWIADARVLPGAVEGRRLIRVQVACVGDTEQERTLRLGGLTGLTEQTRTLELEPGRPARVDFELPAEYDLRGKIAHLNLEPEDGLPSDDHFYLNVDSQAGLNVLVIEGDATPVESLRPGFHLRTALEALATASSQALHVTGKTSANVTPKEIAAADVILLADVPDLSDTNLNALKERVQAGAGLAIFLGPNVKPAFYNGRLHMPLAPAEGLLAAPLEKIDTGDPEPLIDVRWSHPLLAGMFDPLLGDLATARFRSFYRFERPVSKTDTVLGWIDQDTPAMVERRVGAGTVLLFNTTANDDWTDLPRRKSFVPLVDRMLSYLSGAGVRRTFEVGEVVTLALPGLTSNEKVTVLSPSGRRLTPTMQRVGERMLLRLDAVTEPGIYQVERSKDSTAFVVQVGKADSVLTPIDEVTLTRWWEPADFAVVSGDSLSGDATIARRRVALWPWLVALAGLMFLAEMFFVHWLCPRVNPSVAASVIHQRGILAPVGKET